MASTPTPTNLASTVNTLSVTTDANNDAPSDQATSKTGSSSSPASVSSAVSTRSKKAANAGDSRTGVSRSGRSRLAVCNGIQIAATGSYTPSQIVTNEDLAALGCDSDWIVQRTGIRERRRATSKQATSDLAIAAAQDCLKNAKVSVEDVDLIVCATITPDHMTPSTACLVQRSLGALAPSFDVNAACAGFMVGMITASQFVRSGAAKNALVIGAEIMSRAIDTTDIKTYPLFGDAAGAVLLQPCEPTPENGLIRYTIGAEGDPAPLCIPGGGSREPLTAHSIANGRQYLQMDGRTVFKWAVRVVEDSINDLLSDAGVRPDEIDLVILHQANMRILDAAMGHFSIPRERMYVNLDRFGNTSAASIPLALDQANQDGRLKRGNLVLMCGFGAGLSWGTCLVRW